MNKFWMVIASWVSLYVAHVAYAADPAARLQPKIAASNKQSAAKAALAKPKPAAPKYYYVRATPLVALPAAAAAMAGTAAAAMPQAPGAALASAQAATPEADEVHTGRMVCELGNTVTVTPDPQHPSHFVVQMKKSTFHMSPVATTTGAVRLEDAQAGAMWLQLPHKSMLMNSKLGQRMADECQSDHQTVAAHAMKLNPPPSLLDAPTLAKK